jgi:flagellar biosynthesis GTPase FlhF
VSEEFSPSSFTGDGNNDGVRTYRGRTIEELIPRIRAELGPDAIILREREGLTGGIGGFFAQRCVEIDAQSAPRVNVYADELEDAELYEELEGDPQDYEEFEQAPPAGYVPVPLPDAPPPDPTPAPPAPPVPEAAAPAPPGPPVPEAAASVPPAPPVPEPPAPLAPTPTPFLDEASFAARLEEATFAVDVAPEPEPEPDPEPAAAAPPPPSFIAFDELDVPAPAPRVQPPAPETETAPEPVPDGVAELAEVEPLPPVVDPEPGAPEPAVPAPEAAEAVLPAPELHVAPEPEIAEPEPEIAEPEPEVPEPDVAEPEPEPAPRPPAPAPIRKLDPAPWLTFAAESPLPATPEPESEPESEPEPPAAAPEPAASAPEAAPEPAPEPAAPAPEPAPQAFIPPPPPTPAAPAQGARRRGGILPAAERMLRAALDATAAANERRERDLQARQAATPSPPQRAFPGAPATVSAPPPVVAPTEPAAVDEPAPARAPRPDRQTELQRRLVTGGLSPSRAAALLGAAKSRRGPFSADAELAEDVRAMIVASLPTPRGLPVDHGAVAIVGAGGSGKTRSVAALAAAYARAGTLVSVASLGNPGREDALGALLHGEAVNIIPAMRTRATARAVSSARERGLVIIDTAAATPSDDSTIDVMAEALHSFGLDGIYLAIPATLSALAGVKLVDSFSAFDPTGIVATHVDETDQIGLIAELSMQTGIPVAYTHTGLELQNAIAPADPEQIADELLR